MRGSQFRFLATGVTVMLIATACTNTTSSNTERVEPVATSTTATTPERSATPPPTVATTTTTEPEADYMQAQATLDTWAAAIGTSDIDSAVATHLTDADNFETTWEATAYIAATSSHAEFNNCQFSIQAAGDILAECDLTLRDPILAAIDKETVPVAWQLSNDGTTILRSAPGFRASPKNLFVSYAKEQYPDAFAEACGQDTINYNPLVGSAFNRACGEFTAQISMEVSDVIKEAS